MIKVDDILIFGEPERGVIEQARNCQKEAEKVVLMADNHKGYAVPIAGVVAYKDAISPSGVGYDIACGNKAILLDIPAEEVKKNISKIMDDVFASISFGIGFGRVRDGFL